MGDNGFITAALEYKDQSHTERGGWDFRQQYPLVNGAFDPREATIDRFNAWYGEPELDQKTVFVNSGYDVSRHDQALRLVQLPGPRPPCRAASSAARWTIATSSRSIRTAICRSSRPT